MWFMHDVGGWGMFFGSLWMFLFWGGLIALIIWGVNWLVRSNNRAARQTPLDIARERYARGEITSEQFEEIRKELSR